MTKKQWICLGIFLAIVVAFFVVSVVLAHFHDNTLVAEWQSWFGIVKDAIEKIPADETEDVVETLLKI